MSSPLANVVNMSGAAAAAAAKMQLKRTNAAAAAASNASNDSSSSHATTSSQRASSSTPSSNAKVQLKPTPPSVPPSTSKDTDKLQFKPLNTAPFSNSSSQSSSNAYTFTSSGSSSPSKPQPPAPSVSAIVKSTNASPSTDHDKHTHSHTPTPAKPTPPATPKQVNPISTTKQFAMANPVSTRIHDFSKAAPTHSHTQSQPTAIQQPLPLPSVLRAQEAALARQQQSTDSTIKSSPSTPKTMRSSVMANTSGTMLVRSTPEHSPVKSDVLQSSRGHNITATALAQGDQVANASFPTLRYEADERDADDHKTELKDKRVQDTQLDISKPNVVSFATATTISATAVPRPPAHPKKTGNGKSSSLEFEPVAAAKLQTPATAHRSTPSEGADMFATGRVASYTVSANSSPSTNSPAHKPPLKQRGSVLARLGSEVNQQLNSIVASNARASASAVNGNMPVRSIPTAGRLVHAQSMVEDSSASGQLRHSTRPKAARKRPPTKGVLMPQNQIVPQSPSSFAAQVVSIFSFAKQESGDAPAHVAFTNEPNLDFDAIQSNASAAPQVKIVGSNAASPRSFKAVQFFANMVKGSRSTTPGSSAATSHRGSLTASAETSRIGADRDPQPTPTPKELKKQASMRAKQEQEAAIAALENAREAAYQQKIAEKQAEKDRAKAEKAAAAQAKLDAVAAEKAAKDKAKHAPDSKGKEFDKPQPKLEEKPKPPSTAAPSAPKKIGTAVAVPQKPSPPKTSAASSLPKTLTSSLDNRTNSKSPPHTHSSPSTQPSSAVTSAAHSRRASTSNITTKPTGIGQAAAAAASIASSLAAARNEKLHSAAGSLTPTKVMGSNTPTKSIGSRIQALQSSAAESIANDMASYFDPVYVNLFHPHMIPQYQSMLCSGVQVRKHGRSGAPKQRLVYTEPHQYILYYTENEATEPPTKHSLAHSLILLHLVKIEKGKTTEVFRRSTADKVLDSKCISLFDGQRELNLEFDTLRIRDEFFEAIQYVHQTFGLGKPQTQQSQQQQQTPQRQAQLLKSQSSKSNK